MGFEIKKDSFLRSRGGSAEFLDINCVECGSKTLVYQKDGIGSLLRCYIDRIFWPEKYAALQRDSRVSSKKDLPNLSCASCGSVLGIPMEYSRESRLAFRLIPGRFGKRKHHDE